MRATAAAPSALALLAAALASVVGCAGGALPTTHYYTLVSPAAVSERQGAAVEGLAIGVESFEVDPPYDQDRLVFRGSREATEVGFYSYHRWASPVGRLVQSGFVEGLRGTPGVRSIESAVSTGVYDARLGGRVLYLEHIDSGGSHEVRIALELELRGKEGPLWYGALEAEVPGEMSDASRVAGLLATAFDRLVADARRRLAAALAG